MSRGISIALLMLVAVTAGCATTETQTSTNTDKALDSPLFGKMSEATEPALESFRNLIRRKKPIQPPSWNWASAVPVDVIRSQVVGAVIPADQLARLTPVVEPSNIALVSSPPRLASYRVINIDGRTVRNCSDLFTACQSVAEHVDDRRKKPVQVDLIDLSAPENAPETAIELDPRQLIDLGQMIAPDQPAMRITKDGNPWIVYREQSIRCKLMARVEKNCGLLHVVLSIANSGERPKLLPVEVQATCDQQKLKCFSVSEALESIWGQPEPNEETAAEEDYSFASTSEQDAYRIPLNYQRIQTEFDERFVDSTQRPVPAFAVLPGKQYPGAATLGDARALSGFLMQRQMCAPGDPENIGWLVFGGDSLRDGGEIEIAIDLGNGLQKFQFRVPSK